MEAVPGVEVQLYATVDLAGCRPGPDHADATERQQTEIEVATCEEPRKKKGIKYFTPIIRSTMANRPPR